MVHLFEFDDRGDQRYFTVSRQDFNPENRSESGPWKGLVEVKPLRKTFFIFNL